MRGMPIQRPCLNCNQLTTHGTRCPTCTTHTSTQRAARRPPRPHYTGDYRRRAKQTRDNATHCWICGQGPRPGDPWQADHLYPADPNSPLLPAHRSCNAARGNRT